MSYSALIELNRAKAQSEPKTKACVLCGDQISVARMVCARCDRG